MNWIAVGLLAGSLVSYLHKDEEECRGRLAMLEKQKMERLTCFSLSSPTSSYGNTLRLCQNGIC